MVASARPSYEGARIPAGRLLVNGYCDSGDALREVLFNLMLPNTDDLPAQPTEPPEVPLVPRTVVRDFDLPLGRELLLPKRESPAMPEVAVDEDSNLGLSEDQVRPSRQVRRMGLES